MFRDIDRLIVENVKTGEVLATITDDEISTASEDIVVRMRPVYDEPEAHLLTLDDVIIKGCVRDEICWLERKLEDEHLPNGYRRVFYTEYEYICCDEPQIELGLMPFGRNGRYDAPDTAEYGKTWRCWTRKPTEKQRKEAAWA